MKDRKIMVVLSTALLAFLFLPGISSADEVNIRTGDATDITYHNATLYGEVPVLGVEDIEVYFEYGKEGEGDWTETNYKTVEEEGTEFNITVTDLAEDTVYEFRAVGEWNGSEDTGSTETFRTEAYPQVETLDASDITHRKATLHGNLTERGLEGVDLLFRWTEEGQEEWENKTVEEDVTDAKEFAGTVDGLLSNTTYEFEAIAIWDEDNETGEILKFSTETEIYVETLEPSEVTTNSATLVGELLGNETKISEEGANVSFLWWEDIEDKDSTEGEEVGNTGLFERELTDLDSGTEYGFQSRAITDERTFFGEEINFLIPPEVNLTHIELEEEEVYVEEDFGVEVGVENLGDVEYEYEVRFYVDGSLESIEYVNVSGGDTEDLEAEISTDSTGSQDVEATVLDESIKTEVEVYDKPKVITRSPEDVGADSATFKGELVEIGMEDEVKAFFRYGEEGEDEDLWGETSKKELDGEEEYGIEVSLDEETEYRYKAVIEWNDEEDTGESIGVTPDACEYLDWENRTCGGWECNEDEVHQVRKVTLGSPDFCERKLNRCLEAPEHCGKPEVEMKVKHEIVNVTDEGPVKNEVTVINTGTKDLEDVDLEVDIEAPETWFDVAPSSADIDQMENETFEVNFTPGEGAPYGVYPITYRALFEDEEAIDGELHIYPDEGEVDEIKDRYQDLKDGVEWTGRRVDSLAEETDITYIETEFRNFEELMLEAEEAMEDDNYAVVGDRVNEAENLHSKLIDEIERAEEELALPWMWITTGLIIIIILGIFAYLLLPPEEGYEPGKGYTASGEGTKKESAKSTLKRVKEKLLGEDEEGYRYEA